MTTKKAQPQYLTQPADGESNWSAFDQFVAPQPVEKPVESAGVMRTGGDMLIKGAQGVVGLGQAAVGLGSLATGGLVGKGARAIGYDPQQTKEFLGEFLSDSQKASEAAVQKEDTFLGAVGATLANPRALAGSIVESLPGMISGMGAAAGAARTIGARAAAAYGGMGTEAGALAAKAAIEKAGGKLLAVGAGTEGAQTAGQVADDAQAAGRTYSEYAPAAVSAGLTTAAIGFGAGKLVGDAATDLATGARTLTGSKAAKVGKEMFSEGVLEEMPQSAQEQYFTNVAMGEEDRTKGVSRAAGMGMVTGAAMGGGMGMLHGDSAATPEPLPAPPPVPLANTGPLSRAANAAAAAAAAQAAATGPAAAGPASPGAPAAPVQLPALADIDARMNELVAIGHGSLGGRTTDAEGNKVEIPPVAGRRLTPEETAEFGALKQARATRVAIPTDQQAEFDTLVAEEQAERNKKFEPALQAAAQNREQAESDQISAMEAADAQLSQQTALAEQQRIIEETNARVEREHITRAEEARAALRADVLADESIPADGKKAALRAALKREGYRTPVLTDAEHREIDDATAPVPSAPNELVDAVPERKEVAPVSGAPNTQAVDEAIAAGMRLKGGRVLHKLGSTKIFRLSTAQRAYYDKAIARAEPQNTGNVPVLRENSPESGKSVTENGQTVPDVETQESADDSLYGGAVAFVRSTGDASIPKLQQHLKVGYNRAARLLERMTGEGIVTPMTSAGARQVIPEAAPGAEAAAFDAAAQEAATSARNDRPEPTEAQKEAGNYKVGRAKLHGLGLSIENPEGSVRKGVDKAGKPWETTMNHHYGYIRGTVGADKDHIDVFVGKNLNSDKVFVVDQIHPDSGKFDEHKIMLGFDSIDEARAAYQSNYDANWTGGRNITETTLEEFKAWLAGGKTKRPFAQLQAAEAAPAPGEQLDKAKTDTRAYMDWYLTQNPRATVPMTGMTGGRTFHFDSPPFTKAGEAMVDNRKDLIFQYGTMWAEAQKASAPAGAKTLTKQDLNKMTVNDMSDVQLLQAREVFAGAARAPKIDKEIAARGLDDAPAAKVDAATFDEPDAPGQLPMGTYGTVDTPLRFISGMSAPADFAAAFAADKHVGISINALSLKSIPKIAAAMAASKGAYLFIDSGAFSVFMANNRAKAAKVEQFAELEEKGLDFDAIFDKYELLHLAIGRADETGYTAERVFFVMPDIVGDQAGSLELVKRYADSINMGGRNIVPLQGGELTLKQAYETMMRNLGLDPARDISPIIGIPSKARAVSNEQVHDLVKAYGDKIWGIHILGAVADKTLTPRLDVLRSAGYDDGNVSADANRLRSLMWGGTPRAEAMRELLHGGGLTKSIRESAKNEPGAIANGTAPEHVQSGVDDRELGQIVAEFNSSQAEMMVGDHLVSNIFQPPGKREVVRLNDKVKATGKLWDGQEVKAYQKDLAERETLEKAGEPVPAALAKSLADFEAAYLPHVARLEEEAKAEIATWKSHAQEQGMDDEIRRANGRKIVLSLFDLSGEWSKPWEEAGYQVYRFDIQDDPQVGDVNNFSSDFFGDWFGDFDGLDVHAILAATPCTDFAVSGARHFAAKDMDGRTVASVKLVHQTMNTIEYFKPAVWALENPVGRIESLGGLPPWRLSFDPNHLGDSYTKKTLLWGRFNADLPIAPVEPTEGSKMHKLYGGKSMATKNARSVTPEGFSYGFFMANNAHDNPAMTIANKYDRLDRAAIEQALAAGVTEEQINEAVEDFYYMDLDDDAANDALRALVADKAPEPEAVTEPAPDPAPPPKKGKRTPKAAAPAPATLVITSQEPAAIARAVLDYLPSIATWDDVKVAEEALDQLEKGYRAVKDRAGEALANMVWDSVRIFKLFNEGNASYKDEAKRLTQTLKDLAAKKTTVEAPAAPVAAADKAPAVAPQFANNKLFTTDAVEKARARMKAKLGTLNSGLDPELVMDGITIAGAYIESGVRAFSAFSKAMTADLGEAVRPYLRSFYESVRHYPGLDTSGMTPAAELDAMEQAGTAPHTQPSSFKNAAIGETVKVAPKAKKQADVVLRDDWGVTHIDGWVEIAGGKNEQTDYGLRDGLKDAFLKDTQNYLRKVSAELQAHGFSPYRDAKGKLVKTVRVNESGTAGAGDVMLTMFHPEKQHGIYLHVGDSSIRGMVPTTKSGIALMMRVGSQADQSGTKDKNRWLPVNLSAVDLAELAAKAVHARAVAPAQLANTVTINDTETTPAQAETKEQTNDSTPTASAPAIDSPVADGQRPAGAITRGAEQPRERAGRGDAGSVRESRGRDPIADDAREDLGNERGADAVSDRPPVAVARGNKRVSADFRPDVGGLTREGSWLDTAARNVDLIELALTIERENRPATAAEQAQLSKYVGFGASAIRNKLFPIPPSYSKQQDPNRLIWPNLINEASWRGLAERMEALPAAWQRSVLQSSQYAHYTSEGIIRSTWSAMQRLGFTGGKVFEPGMGIGSFSMLMPDTVRDTSRYTGVEFDGPTALIARLLSPEQNMLHDDFIKRKFPRDYFDVAIGNPPFSQTQIFADPDYEKHGFMLHDFFFAKSIDRVRPGGLLAFVTSKGTMDKQTDKARKYLSARADLLGAIRLPSTAFEDNAGTSVVTDVIFLRKRHEHEAPAGQAWANVASVDTKDGVVVINEYFANNPAMVLGQNRVSGNTDDMGRRINANGRGAAQYTVVSYDDTAADLDAKFAAAIEHLPENAYSVLAQTRESVQRETAKVDFDPSVKREGVVYLAKDGAIMRVENGVGQPLADGMKMTEADKAWFAGYIGIRDLVNETRLAQASDGKWEASLKKLNKAYDTFRAEHGPINDFRVQVRKSTDEEGNTVETESRIFKNRRRFREDYDSAILTQLETINEAGDIVKSPFLLGRTIGKPVTRDVRTIGDALAVSLDDTGRLNLDDVGRRIGLSRDDTIEALGNQVYQAPAGDWQLADEYLSGDVVSKLEEAEQAARVDDSLARNVEALKAVQPEKLGPSQISAKLGASWVPAAHVNAFAAEIDAGAVTFDPKTETWQVDGGNLRSARRAGAEYGTAARSPSELLETALNSRSLKVTMKIDGKSVTDQEATTAANEMLKKIKDKFKGWIWTDSERASELVESYNKRYNNIAPRRFDGAYLTLPGVSMRYTLHPHQKNGIARIIQTGNTYLNHAVGSGKTIEMIAAGMEQKRLGLINKPMYVVPNHMLEQFSNEFMELYPLANIMVADDENFSAERRKAFIASATLNNPDAVIITHDAFQRIGVKEESVAPIRDEILADLEIELSETAKDNGARVRRSQLEQQIEAVTQRFDRIIAAGGKDSTLKFEDIGVDFVFADEAHVFRKLDFHTAQQIKGIDPNGSKRALDMYVKTRWLEQQRPGRAMVFASGTPVTNTMGELYTIMRFFAPEEMNRAGIATFDAWARQFGEVAPALEPNAAGKYELIERFAKFDNVPELMSRVRQFMDVLTSEHLGALVKRPDLIGGKPNLNIVPAGPALDLYMKTVLGPRIEKSKKWKPTKDEPNNPDPIVSIITDGRFAAIDPRFFGGALGEEGSIITEMGDKVVTAYHAGKHNVYQDKNGKDEPIKGSTQVVFYNMGFGEQSQKNRGFNSRAAFTKRLTDGGIPRDQIAWFDDANTDAKKEAVFKDMRSGKLRVLIGSAKKMGTGVNVQKRLAVLHYQDPPWFPADVEQPHGRIIRQGNQNAEVAIEWYTTKGTYQSTMWQMVGRKQRFIDQAFSGDKTLRSMEDMGEASLFEQAAAVASGDPRAIQLAGLKQEVERFERLQAAHASEQINVRSALRSADWQVESSTKRINSFGAAFKAIGERFYAFTTGKVGNAVFDKVGEFGQAVKDAFNKVAADSVMGTPARELAIGTLGEDLTLTVDAESAFKKPTGEFTLYVNVGDLALSVSTTTAMGESVDAVGLGRRIVNQVNSISADLNRAKAELTSGQNDLVRLRKKVGAPFEYQQEMAEKYGDLKRLEEELRMEGIAAPAVPIVINEDGSTAEEAGPAPDAPDAPAFSRTRIDSDDPLVGIFSQIAQDDDAFRMPGSDTKSLAGILADMAPGATVDDSLDAPDGDGPGAAADRVWMIDANDGRAFVFRDSKKKQMWLDISNWKEGRMGARIYQAVATFAHNTGYTFIGDPSGLSDKALYRRTEQMISSALRHGTTAHLAPHALQTEAVSTMAGQDLRPIKWQAGEHASNLREMLVSSYTNILQVFPEINDVTYNFGRGRFERTTPVRAPAGDVRADGSAAGQQADGQGAGSGDARSVDGRSADGHDEAAGDVGPVDAVAFTDANFAAAAKSVRAAFDVLFPSGRGAFTPPLGMSDLKRAVLVGTVLRGEGRADGRAVLDHVSDRLLQRVSPQLTRLLYSRDAEFFRNDGNFPSIPAGDDAGTAAPVELTGAELLAARKATEQLNRELVKVGIEPVRALRAAPNAQFALARRIGETMGIKVNFVSKNAEFEGVAYNGIAYLAEGMRNAELAIAGHETLHALEQSNPELGTKLRTQIRAYLKNGVVEDRQAREYAANGLQDVSTETAEAEVIADINGAMWMDPVFWRDLAKVDRSLFRTVAYKFMELATSAITSMRGSRFDVSALVRDVEAVRAIMVATWAENNGQRDAAVAVQRSMADSSVALPRGEWLANEAVAKEVNDRIGQFAHKPSVEVHDSAFGVLPGVAFDERVSGAVYEGKIYLFRDALSDLREVQRTLFHELLHYGLQRYLPKEQYITRMKALYQRDGYFRSEADRWAKGEQGQLAASYGGQDYAIARGVDEALAQLAEPNAGEYLKNGLRDRAERAVQRWLASLAQFFGMTETAAYWRSIKNEEARTLIQQMFKRLKSDLPPADPWAGGSAAERRSGARSSTTTPAGAPAFSRASLGDALANAAGSIADVRLPADYRIGDLFNASGKVSWWHKSIGTMDNLAKRAPAFGRVYEAVQSFLGDVSRFAVVSADMAPTLLPKLENIADIIGKNRKKALTAGDTKAIGAPIFEGTLSWARDANGKPVKMAELEEQAAGLTTAQRAQILLQKGIIDDAQNAAWLANPLGMYERIINGKFEETQLKAGVVWTDAELRDMFSLNDGQIALYHEFRAALDKSLTNLTISEMVKLGGKDAKGMIEQAVAAPNLNAAADLLRDHFMALAEMHPERADMYLDTAKQILNLADKGTDLMDRGYAPLSRFGKYTVYVQERNDQGEFEQVYFGMFETQYEASKMARDMAAEHPQASVSHGTISADAYKLFAGVSPETIELFGSMVGLDSQADAQSTEVYQTYLKLAKNNRSSMKRMIHRKGIAGFSEDAGRVLAGFIYSNARLTAGNAHLGEIDEAVTEIPKQQGELTDAAMQLREHIRNPEPGTQLGGLMFAQFLGGSVASAMVNLTQPFTMTLPYLSQWGGIGKAGKRMTAAVRDALKDTTGDAGLDAALKWAADEGIVAPQEVHYLQAQAQGKGALRAGDGTKAGNARAHVNNAMAKISLGWGKLFAMAELSNRRITFIAAYRTAVEEGLPNPARFAEQSVSQTQGTYNSGNKPKWARSAIGGLLLTFKQFSISYLELLSRMAFAGEKGSKERAAGRRAALYMIAVLFLMGGADGLPFAQDLEDAIDGLLQRLGFNFSTKRSKQAFLTDVLGRGGADFALKGISSLPGMPVDVSGRFGMGNLIPGTGLMTKKDSYARDLGELAGPAGDLAKRAFTGAGKALGGDLAGAALDLSPVAVRNVAKGVDMLDSGAYRDARGYIVNNTTPTEAMMKMIGFQPNSTADVQDQKGQALGMIAQNRMRSVEIAEHWAQGLATGNAGMVQEARDMRADWNEKNPETPIRVNLPAIIRRVRAMKQDAIVRTQKTAPAALKQSVRAELAETRE
ncbi:PLxRFG domain-containing protein [Massilia sp. TSP1-1-2]|uniref:PLxRFG domain-containing protein n=1 Tax=Massilia sp. TSP1-1-2 TaxID=2804649 RepID=UPI003CE78516